VISAKGRKISVESIGKIVSYEGKPADLISLRDVTERKRAEEALRLVNRKLNLLSGITRHDITNQLTVLKGHLAFLEKRQPDSTYSTSFGKINDAANRILSMIRFTKEYEAIGVHAPAWQNCRRLADTAVKQTAPGRIHVKNDLPETLEIFADPLIATVFYNLVENAVRYGGKVTTIRFFSEGPEDHLVIVCEDDGDGIPAAEKEKIFERGFGKNTGLGLFLAREILSITGITIRETGVPGTGARYEIIEPSDGCREKGEEKE
jgi:signal transduction histidine kinase